ncbi:hypothetical protein NSQ96_03570 [Caldifermentibacillus hisashii]|uniref:hypothetical protein n=1 Tax=Caldifermentibacillus hisashii TaxID=996558 RepID=UPI0031FDAE59
MVTRSGLVAKVEHFSLQNGDEIQARRQKIKFSTSKGRRDWVSSSNFAFLTPKWRRDRVSSPKQSIFHFKTVTRSGFVAKIEHFSLQNGDEIGFRRQKALFSTPNWRRD